MNNLKYIIFSAVFLYTLLIVSCSDETTAPEPPTRLVILYYPEYDMIIPDTPVTFRWGTTTQIADSFKLDISHDSNFASFYLRQGLTVQQYTIDLPVDTNYYYWRVAGFWRNPVDSDMSITNKFRQR
jgi:hypothetical protein